MFRYITQMLKNPAQTNKIISISKRSTHQIANSSSYSTQRKIGQSESGVKMLVSIRSDSGFCVSHEDSGAINIHGYHDAVAKDGNHLFILEHLGNCMFHIVDYKGRYVFADWGYKHDPGQLYARNNGMHHTSKEYSIFPTLPNDTPSDSVVICARQLVVGEHNYEYFAADQFLYTKTRNSGQYKYIVQSGGRLDVNKHFAPSEAKFTLYTIHDNPIRFSRSIKKHENRDITINWWGIFNRTTKPEELFIENSTLNNNSP